MGRNTGCVDNVADRARTECIRIVPCISGERPGCDLHDSGHYHVSGVSVDPGQD